MFSDVIKALPTDEKRRNAIRAFLMGEIEAKRFHITPVLMEQEPFKTLGLEALDGVVVDSGRPQYGVETILTDLPEIRENPVRLIAIRNDGSGGLAFNPNGNVVVRRVKNIVIPGTTRTKRTTMDEKLGPDAKLSHREARLVLVHYGWPMRDEKSGGNRLGTVVEWEWLQMHVKSPTAQSSEIVLYESIRDALEAQKNEAPKSSPKTIKAGAEARP